MGTDIKTEQAPSVRSGRLHRFVRGVLSGLGLLMLLIGPNASADDATHGGSKPAKPRRPLPCPKAVRLAADVKAEPTPFRSLQALFNEPIDNWPATDELRDGVRIRRKTPWSAVECIGC
jgi:hypothetical protein